MVRGTFTILQSMSLCIVLVKVWRKMLEKDYNHKFLPFEEQFASVTISTDSDAYLNDLEGS